MKTVDPRCERCLKSRTNLVHVFPMDKAAHKFVPHVKHNFYLLDKKMRGGLKWYRFGCRVCGSVETISKFRLWLKPVKMPVIDMTAFKASMALLSQAGINASDIRAKRG